MAEMPRRETLRALRPVLVAFGLFLVVGFAAMVPIELINQARHQRSVEDRAALRAMAEIGKADRATLHAEADAQGDAIKHLVERTRVGDADRERAIQMLTELRDQFRARESEHATMMKHFAAIELRLGVTEREVEKAQTGRHNP